MHDLHGCFVFYVGLQCEYTKENAVKTIANQAYYFRPLRNRLEHMAVKRWLVFQKETQFQRHFYD